MNDNVVIVTSMTNGITVLQLPEFHYRRVWPKKGAKVQVSKEILEASIYMPGVERLFTEGNLWIEDAAFRKELGLESEGTKDVETGEVYEEKTLINMNDQLCNRIIKLMPEVDVKAIVNKLSPTQKEELVEYAINHSNDLSYDRIELLTNLLGTNILSAIQMKKEWSN